RCEELESRLVPSCSPSIVSGQLRSNCDNAANTVTLDRSGSFEFINGVGFSETLFSSVLINTGSASDTVKVYATGKPTTIDGGGGQDYVIVGDPFNNAQYIQGALTVKNPPAGGYTTLYVNDYGESNNRIFTISESAITGLTPAPINYVQYDLKAL